MLTPPCPQERAVAHEMGAVQKARTEFERLQGKYGQLQKDLMAAIKTLEGWVGANGGHGYARVWVTVTGHVGGWYQPKTAGCCLWGGPLCVDAILIIMLFADYCDYTSCITLGHGV
jgi:hypothetical protein